MLSSKKWQGYGLSTRKFPSVTLSLLPQLSKGNHRPSLMPRQLPRRPQPKSRFNAQRQNVPAPWFLRTKSIYDLFTTLCFPPPPCNLFPRPIALYPTVFFLFRLFFSASWSCCLFMGFCGLENHPFSCVCSAHAKYCSPVLASDWPSCVAWFTKSQPRETAAWLTAVTCCRLDR